MRYNRIGNDKDGYEDVPFTAEEETVKNAEIQAAIDELPARQMIEIRRHRDSLLKETDWMALEGHTMSDAWKTYRQELRDIPATNTIFKDVTWPSKPE